MIFTEATIGPYEAGEVGGDGQVSPAYARCWTAKQADGTYATVTVTFYLFASDAGGGDVKLLRETEYLVCADPEDPFGTEKGSDYLYETVEAVDPTEDDAHDWCARVMTDEITWRDPLEQPVLNSTAPQQVMERS